MISDWRKEFNKLIASLKNTREVEELLRELFTPAEYDECARRWQIVKMLIKGSPQRAISKRLSVSVATVSRGARELKYGGGAFKKHYNRIHHQHVH